MSALRFIPAGIAGALFLFVGGLLPAAPASAQADAATETASAAPGIVAFDIPAQDLGEALSEFARQSGQELLFAPEAAQDRSGNAVIGEMTRGAAMEQLLDGTGLEFLVTPDGGMMIGEPATVEAYRSRLRQRSGESAAALAGQNTVGQRRPGIEEIIVTGQKREERIQDVPIAISAFSMEDLKTSQIAGGPDLHLQVPNMTFTKTNFTGYSIQIRGIGTQAISATTDPAVAVALNNTPFIRNSFFEQEFYDLERVEVLRGPQGTLFGRNATAGVVNLVTAKPKFQYESMASLDMGNYNSRRWEFMVNQPFADDQVALRIAGAGTKRDGYATNELTENPIDGRDLWSTRVSLRIAPTGGNFDMNLLWERFEEDDDRIRSGKQLCHKDVVTEVAGVPRGFNDPLFDTGQGGFFWAGVQGSLSQGCTRGSLYSENAFQTPNGWMLPYYAPLSAIFLPAALDSPYASTDQSRDLRVIESVVDPEYRAQSDIGQIQLKYELTDTLTLDSETAYSRNSIFSLEDFNRFNTAAGAWDQRRPHDREGILEEGPDGGIFCDPQLGCSDRLVVVDISSAESEQFSQEFRLSSQFAGPLDFSLGANYLRYDTVDKFYVFANSFTLSQANFPGSRNGTGPWVPGISDNSECLDNGFAPHDPDTVAFISEVQCFYIDPNSIENVNDLGHNYFLSKNPYELTSYGIFGEAYYRITDNLKLTAGLRWSVDDKTAPRIPSQLFASQSTGHPVGEVIEQTWREPTGRLVLDWKPTLDFTDETLIYGSYAHGYKAGGANPPAFRVATRTDLETAQILNRKSALKPKTFDAEFVDAFEIGTKNTLADGAVTLNLAAFYYDYEGYQISEIVDRAAFNRNFDAEVWGAELEADWWARENLRLGLKLGYQKTRIADGEKAIDLMDRTAGGKHFTITDAINPNFDENTPEQDLLPFSEYVAGYGAPSNQEFFAFENWVVLRPFPTFPSSCVIPEYLLIRSFNAEGDATSLMKPGGASGGNPGGCEFIARGWDPATRQDYVPNPGDEGIDLHLYPQDYPGWNPLDESQGHNFSEGFFKDLGGNEFPNAPNWTATITADYIIPLQGDWLATLHTDIYWQSESWWRIFNDHEYNRIDDYFTMNLAAIFKNEVTGWDIMAYVKNVTDEDAITGAFLYSDDVGLTTNTFLVEPRLAGIRVTKHWDGGGPAEWLGGAGAALLGKEPGEPTPWELTVGGYLLRPNEARVETFSPEFITNFDPNIDPTGEQAGDMDWGNGREIVLTYAPENGWRFSLGARFGESKRDERANLKGETVTVCPSLPIDCTEDSFFDNPDPLESRVNYGLTELKETEEHLLIDFMVGRDVGMGALVSTLSAGLRYVNFESRSDVMLRGTPDWDLPEQCWNECKYGFFPNATFVSTPGTRNEYQGVMKAKREFQGIGPVASWEASSRLLGDDARHLDLDWALTGGVLFGKQRTTVEGVAQGLYFIQTENEQRVEGDSQPDDSYATPFEHERDDNRIAAVPTLGADLGLTYRIKGASIGAGYRWERYYGVIDGGIEERREYDRTLDGPYLKVTFGGGS